MPPAIGESAASCACATGARPRWPREAFPLVWLPARWTRWPSTILLAGLGNQARYGARSGKAEDAHGRRTGHLRGIEPFHLTGGGQRFVHAAGNAVLHHLYHVVAALLAHTEH